jgi:lipopolysaccharide/colanic/teichoic acid biosynthesis glycosyltransferase
MHLGTNAASFVAKKTKSQERSTRNSEGSPADNYLIAPRNWWYPPMKAALEHLLAIALLIVTSPIVLLSVLFIRLTSPGPAIYRQTRVGKDGRLFTIYKLRTMRHNCEALSGPQWAAVNDVRVTPVGRVLRATHIDEFPQLWNVLRGEMSLVGPRPERPEFVNGLQELIPYYENRLAIRPGITGLAQVKLPPDASISCVQTKVMHDLYYVQRMGPWLDLRLLFCTVFASLGIPVRMVAKVHRALLMPTLEVISQVYESALAGTSEADDLEGAQSNEVAEPAALTQLEPA